MTPSPVLPSQHLLDAFWQMDLELEGLGLWHSMGPSAPSGELNC